MPAGESRDKHDRRTETRHPSESQEHSWVIITHFASQVVLKDHVAPQSNVRFLLCVCVFVYFYLFIYFYSCLGQILCTRVKFLSCLQGFHGNLGLVMCSCSFGSVGGVGGGTDEVSSSSPPRSMVQIVAINVYFQHCVKKVAPVCSICLQHNLQRLQGIYKTG